jgi:hypothetical protein
MTTGQFDALTALLARIADSLDAIAGRLADMDGTLTSIESNTAMTQLDVSGIRRDAE